MADEFKGNRRAPWGRRILIALVIGLIALVPAYFVWVASLQRRLDAEVAALRAAGEPIMLSDLATAPVPDELNAAIDLRRAAAMLSMATTQDGGTWQQITNDEFTLPMTDEKAAQVRAAVAENPNVLDDVAKATTKPAVDWQIAYASPAISVLLPDLNHQRNLAMFVKAAALDAHLRGDEAAALEKVRHMLFQAGAVAHQPFLVGQLVALGVSSLACSTAEQIAPDLRVGGSPAGATPEQVRAVIDDLLDDAAMAEGFRRGLRGERVIQLDTVRSVNNGTIPLSAVVGIQGNRAAVIPLAIDALLLRDGLIMLEHTSGVLAAAGEKDLSGFQRASPPMPDWMNRGGGFGHPLAKPMMPAYLNAGQTFYRGLAERRLVAALLAIRWYACEHEGRRPRTLDDLVPRYLPAVPIDPLAAGGKPLRYAPDDERPSVYSVGTDGQDHNGSSVGPNRWANPDFVFPLDRPKPATQPAEDPALMP